MTTTPTSRATDAYINTWMKKTPARTPLSDENKTVYHAIAQYIPVAAGVPTTAATVGELLNNLAALADAYSDALVAKEAADEAQRNMARDIVGIRRIFGTMPGVDA